LRLHTILKGKQAGERWSLTLRSHWRRLRGMGSPEVRGQSV